MSNENLAATGDRQLPAEIKSRNTVQVHATRFDHRRFPGTVANLALST